MQKPKLTSAVVIEMLVENNCRGQSEEYAKCLRQALQALVSLVQQEERLQAKVDMYRAMGIKLEDM